MDSLSLSYHIHQSGALNLTPEKIEGWNHLPTYCFCILWKKFNCCGLDFFGISGQKCCWLFIVLPMGLIICYHYQKKIKKIQDLVYGPICKPILFCFWLMRLVIYSRNWSRNFRYRILLYFSLVRYRIVKFRDHFRDNNSETRWPTSLTWSSSARNHEKISKGFEQ